MTPQHRTAFAERLRLVQFHSGKNKSAFARNLGVGDTTLANYFAGKTAPTLVELVAVCNNFGTSIEWLVFGAGPQQRSEVGSSAAHVPMIPTGDLERRAIAAVVKYLERCD